MCMQSHIITPRPVIITGQERWPFDFSWQLLVALELQKEIHHHHHHGHHHSQHQKTLQLFLHQLSDKNCEEHMHQKPRMEPPRYSLSQYTLTFSICPWATQGLFQWLGVFEHVSCCSLFVALLNGHYPWMATATTCQGKCFYTLHLEVRKRLKCVYWRSS